MLTIERLLAIKEWMLDKVKTSSRMSIWSTSAPIGGFYADWTGYGRGITDYLCAGHPPDGKG